MNKRKTIGKILEWTFLTICIVFLMWFVISFFNVNMYNLTNPEKIASWNFFKIFLEICK